MKTNKYKEKTFKMKYTKLFTILLCLAAAFTLALVASADDTNHIGPYQKIDTIVPPGGLVAFDISWVDSASEIYYLADRGADVGQGRIDIVDAEHDTFVTAIGGFSGNLIPKLGFPAGLAKSGPNGIVAIHKKHELWVGDGDSTVKVVDLDSRQIVATIPTGGAFRADELAYDPIDHIIVIANDQDTPPFVTFISQETRKVVGKLPYPQSTGGLEQSVWDQQTKKFYLSVPSTVDNPNGEVDEIDPQSMKVTRIFPIGTPCGPAGLALLPGQRLITSCGVVLSARTGATLATINGVNADEIWYNPGDDRVYFGLNPVSVVDADNYSVITTIAVPGSLFATHSVAADSENNHIFIPVSASKAFPGGGILVYTDSTDQEGTKDK